MPFRSQRQRLHPLEQLKGRKRIQGGTQIPQDLDADADGKGDGSKGVEEPQAVVAFGGIVELREALSVLAPVELASIDDDAGDGSPVTADPFGGRVHDDVGAVFDRPKKVAARAKGVVDLDFVSAEWDEGGGPSGTRAMKAHHEGNTSVVSHLGDGGQVRDVISGVPNALDVDGLGPVVDRLGEPFGVVPLDELGGDAQPRHKDLELVIGAPVQIRGRDDVIADVGQGGDGHELCRLAGRGGHGGDAAFQRRHPFLKHIDGGLKCVGGQQAWDRTERFGDQAARLTFMIRL